MYFVYYIITLYYTIELIILGCHHVVSVNVPPIVISYWLHVMSNSLSTLRATVLARQREAAALLKAVLCDKEQISQIAINITIKQSLCIITGMPG